MSRPLRPSRLVVASLAFGVALPSLAWAESTRDKVLAISTQSLKANGAKDVTWGKVDGDDARFSVADLKIVSEAEGKIGTMTVAKTTWTGAAVTPEGGISADEVAAEGLGFESDDAKIKADRMVLTKYRGPSPDKVVPGKISGERIDQATVTGITFTSEDGKTFPVASASFSATDYVGDTPRKAAFELKGLVVPLDPHDSDLEQVRALGYEKATIDASFSGTWDDKTGRLAISSFTVGAADMGTLKIAATIGGVTPEVVDAMKKAEADQTKQMELLQGLTVEALSLRWDDASLTGRVLDRQAKDQGVDTKTYAKQLKLLMPAMLSMIGNKDFEKKVAGATGSFLDSPKSLTVSARPKAPVPFGQLMGAAMAMPQTLPAVLGVEVVAND
ncbi:MAG: hypothetical protein GX458_01000 [Phyllobacteriaceae bacterium]|nr:hypothetical protein [Phyllobacteriaceae bacterium]